MSANRWPLYVALGALVLSIPIVLVMLARDGEEAASPPAATTRSAPDTAAEDTTSPEPDPTAASVATTPPLTDTAGPAATAPADPTTTSPPATTATPATAPPTETTPPATTAAPTTAPLAETTTPTPERCLDCAGEPPAGVAAQLNTFYGGADPRPCGDHLWERLQWPPYEPFAGVSFYTPAWVGTHTWFCLAGFDEGAIVDVRIDFPDGTSRFVEWHFSKGTDYALEVLDAVGPVVIHPAEGPWFDGEEVGYYQEVLWPLRPGYPLGEYRVTAEQHPSANDAEAAEAPPFATTSFQLVPGQVPNVETVLPQRFGGTLLSNYVHQPGRTMEFLLSGFVPGSAVEPFLYYFDFDGERCEGYCYAMPLPSIVVDDVGSAVYEFPTEPTDPEGKYCLATVETHWYTCTSRLDPDLDPELWDQVPGREFSSEFYLGEPEPY